MMQLIQKFAIKYYVFLFFHLIIFYIINYLHDSAYAFSFINFNLIVGKLLFYDTGNTIKGKQFNKNIFHVGPLIVSCFLTAVQYIVYWINYEQIVRGSFLLWVLTLLSLSFSVVASIDAAHQLIHRNQKICRIIGYLCLWFHQFTAYPIEHLYLHHKKVGTAQDPITSSKNLSIYKYFVRALKSAYKFNYLYNKIYFLLCILATLSFIFTIIGFGIAESASIAKIILFILSSYVTVFLMECVQYIEHYGLIYRKDVDTPITQVCSWNSVQNGYINFSIFKFQRHSDHHINAYKIFTSLDLTDKMPIFPFDFMQGIMWCLNPTKWYQLINPLVDKYIQGKQVSKEHMNKINTQKNKLTYIIIVFFIIHSCIIIFV